MNIADEKEVILARLYQRYKAITEQHKWSLQDMNSAMAQAIKELEYIGVEIKGTADTMQFNNDPQHAKAAIANGLLSDFGEYAPSTRKVESYLHRVKENISKIEANYDRRNSAKDLKDIARECRKGMDQTLRDIQLELNRIKKLDEKGQGEAMTELWNNWVKHEGGKYGKVDGKLLGQTDLQKASGLTTTTSEQPLVNLGRAIQRGRFKPQDGNENPTAQINGKVDTGEYQKRSKGKYTQKQVIATAELTPREGETSEVVRAIAEKWASTESNLGPKSEAILAIIESFWLKRKDSKNRITLTVDELAEAAGYKRRQQGDFSQSSLDTIREALRGVARITIVTTPQTIRGVTIVKQEEILTIGYLTMKGESKSLIEQGDYVGEYIEKGKDKPEYNWTSITVRPNSFFCAVVDKGLTKAVSFKKYQLDAVHDRLAGYLITYLEDIWRSSYRNERGVKRFTIRTILAEGMEIEEAVLLRTRRKKAVLDDLEETLEKVQDLGCISYFEFPREYLRLRDNKGGKRLTNAVFRQILDLSIYIEAGGEYKQYYKGKLNPPKLPDTVQELQEYLVNSGTTNARAAEELRVTNQTMKNWLSGKSKPPKNREATIRSYLDSNKGDTLTLQLF